MQIRDYITTDIQALKLTSTIGEAKEIFKELTFTHLPVVDANNLYGLIAERDLLSFDDDAIKLENVQYMLHTFFVFEEDNWIDILKQYATNEANILPVLNTEKKYVGYLELIDILHFFNKTPFLQEQGTVLVISKNKNDYSVSEIAQIIESNDAKLFGVLISKIEGDDVELTIKVMSNNINDVIHTFRRYNYGIVLGIKEDEYLNDLKARSAYLQKYLNI